MNTNYKRKKRSYPTEFKRAYLTGLLPPSLVNNIPASTLSSWRNKSLHNLYGYDFIYTNDEQLDFYQVKKRYESLIKVTKALAIQILLSVLESSIALNLCNWASMVLLKEFTKYMIAFI